VEEDNSSECSLARAVCIVGLGNPGRQYEGTPHNLGFLVIDELARRNHLKLSKFESGALTGTGRLKDRNVILVKPQTFVNLSGGAVAEILKYRNLTNRELVVVYDELDLDWTALRIKKNGSAAGHNGVRSIIAVLKTDAFIRVRVGIHPRHHLDAAQYVLTPWERELRDEVGEMVSYTAEAVEAIIAKGADKAMATYNRRARGLQKEEE
jgi:peptidyl-tRNA hydrolase, PTH1 family